MWEYYGYSRRRDVKGGIRLQSKRGESSSSWWGLEWNKMLYRQIDDSRLSRGRTYARHGQVISINIKDSVVYGVVQGSMRTPYNVTIKVKPLNAKEWGMVADLLMARPAIAADLLAGRMTNELESVFMDAGLSLFKYQPKFNCSCYDWDNPCKHAAAVYLILSEQIDRDPFLILRLRGMDQAGLLEMMGIRLPKYSPGENDASSVLAPSITNEEPLPIRMGSFWGRRGEDLMGSDRADIPDTAAEIPRRLGVFPYWRSENAFIEELVTVYTKASEAGMAIFLEGFEHSADTQSTQK